MAALAVVAAGFSLTFSVAQVAARSDRALAYRLAPYVGRIGALQAASLSGPEATAADRGRADIIAHQALLADPTAVGAASTLGLNAQIRGNTSAARRLFIYAERLSRRNYETQLWAIEDAVGRQNVPDALRHYDIALRTAGVRASDQLFPILAGAITEAEVRAELVRRLAAKPAWSDDFISYTASNSPDPRSAAHLLTSLRHAGVRVADGASAALVAALLNGGAAEDAWSYFASIRAGADRRRVRDPHFADSGLTASPFDWSTFDEGGVSVSIQRGDKGGVVDFTVPASAAGPLLQQVQMLPPGEYRLSGHSENIQQAPDSLPYWALKCRGDDRELGRVVVPNSAAANGNFAGSFVVPATCPVQVLVLIARPSDAAAGLSGQIDRADLAPAG